MPFTIDTANIAIFILIIAVIVLIVYIVRLNAKLKTFLIGTSANLELLQEDPARLTRMTVTKGPYTAKRNIT